MSVHIILKDKTVTVLSGSGNMFSRDTKSKCNAFSKHTKRNCNAITETSQREQLYFPNLFHHHLHHHHRQSTRTNTKGLQFFFMLDVDVHHTFMPETL